MKLTEIVESIARDMVHQAKRFALYRELEKLLADVDTLSANVYAYESDYEARVYVEFSPGWGDSEKNLQPLVHKLARKFHVKFEKRLSHDESTIEYRAEVPDQMFREVLSTIAFKITGALPKSCRVEEIITPLSDEEIELNRQEALKSVKTERVTRKVVCK